MTSNHFEEYNRLNEIPHLVRDDIAHIINYGDYIVFYNWLEIVESSCLKSGYQPCYIVGFSNQLVIGMAVNFILPGLKVKNGISKNGILKLSIGILPLSNETNIFLRHQEYQEAFMKGYLSIIHKRWPPTVYVFLPFNRLEKSFENNIDRNYLKRAYYPSSYLEVKFNSFEQYLKQLNKRRRYPILKNIKRFEKNGCYFEYCEKPGKYQDRLYELTKNVAQKNTAQGSPFLLERSTFNALENNMKDQFHVILAKKENEIIGFKLIFEKNRLFDNRIVGLDYRYVKKTAVYFNLYYESIRLAISRNIRQLEMSITQMQIKKRLGCKTKQHHAFITTTYNWMTHCADLFGMVPEDRFRDQSKK